MSRWMRRVFPSPLLSTLLLAAWLMLNGSASTGQLLLGVLLAWAVPRWTARFAGPRPRLHAPAAVLRLAAVVLWDIVVSNVEVARRVLGPQAALQPCFVWVPLALRNPHGIAALAGIITLTPGTLSSELTEDHRHLLVHALHCTDEAALVATIQARYEAPLREIFE